MDCAKCLLATTLCSACHKHKCPYHMYESGMDKICITCYDKVGRRRIKSSERVDLQNTLRLVRKLVPQGFVSITWELNEHQPGDRSPTFLFGIYHAEYGHTHGVTLQDALEMFRKKVLGLTTDQEEKV